MLNRQTEERWLDAMQTVIHTITSSYDAASQLTSISDAFASYAYQYDNLGRVTSSDNASSPTTPHIVLSTAYDAVGNRTSLDATIDGIADFQNDYTFDALGRMTRITQADGSPSAGYAVTSKRVDLAYNAAGQFTQIDRYEDLAATLLVATSTYGYDTAGRLTSLNHDKSLTSLAAYGWTYDTAGRLTQTTSPDGTSTYTYDGIGQLTDATHTYQTDESFAWDLNGNPTGVEYTVDADNRLVSDATYDYQYDAEGNRTHRADRVTGDYLEYEWDHRNRLVAVEHRASGGALTKRAELDYDPFDRLIGKRVDDDGNGTFDRAYSYVYDGADLTLVFDDAGSLTNRLLHGPATDQVFADEDALGEILWNLADNQQTVRDVVDYDAVTDTATVVNHLKYSSFGEIGSQTDPTFEPIHTYTGQIWDADVDAFHYNARWYDPHARRFLSTDPLGLGPDSNRYRYVGNSPANFTDPDGLWQQPSQLIQPSAEGGEPIPAEVLDLFEEAWLRPHPPVEAPQSVDRWLAPRYTRGISCTGKIGRPIYDPGPLVVVLYDGDDGGKKEVGGSGWIAHGGYFEGKAEEWEHRIEMADSNADTIDAILDFADGTIDVLKFYDHGGAGKGQQVGDDRLTPEFLEAIGDKLADDARIELYGCNVGEYPGLQDLANAVPHIEGIWASTSDTWWIALTPGVPWATLDVHVTPGTPAAGQAPIVPPLGKLDKKDGKK